MFLGLLRGPSLQDEPRHFAVSFTPSFHRRLPVTHGRPDVRLAHQGSLDLEITPRASFRGTKEPACRSRLHSSCGTKHHPGDELEIRYDVFEQQFNFRVVTIDQTKGRGLVAMFALGVWLYVSATRARDRIGRYAFLAYITLLIVSI
jgi:hypothetical protein